MPRTFWKKSAIPKAKEYNAFKNIDKKKAEDWSSCAFAEIFGPAPRQMTAGEKRAYVINKYGVKVHNAGAIFSRHVLLDSPYDAAQDYEKLEKLKVIHDKNIQKEAEQVVRA